MTNPLTIGIVANEPSGDQLGAALVRELSGLLPHARFIGVAGPKMQAAGCTGLLPLERLSVMGLVEVARHLPQLLLARRRLVQHFLRHPPAVLIGIDAPDFNLGLERRLRVHGIPTVHVVSPTVWAWRPGRVKTIRRSVDLLLSLFPFEESFLRQHGIPARYIGHPLADEILPTPDPLPARHRLGLSAEDRVIALLPGSRVSEMARLAEPFLRTASWCRQQRGSLRFVVPLVNSRLRDMFLEHHRRVAPQLDLTLVDGQSREVIAASDIVLTASGTATLETLLTGRPMVVAYRVNALTYRLVTGLKLVKVPYIAMSNLLVGQELAPEFIQDRCQPELIGPALFRLLDDPHRIEYIRRRYRDIHRQLARHAARQAAEAIAALIARARRA